MATEYGMRLRAARKHANLTQVKLSELTGIAQSTISTAEREGNGSSDTPVYAKECGVDAHWLATGKGEMLPSAAPAMPAPMPAHGGPALEQALEVVAQSLESLSPILQQAGKSTLEKWVHGQASLAETATTLAALAQASQSLPSAPAVAETPVPKPQNT